MERIMSVYAFLLYVCSVHISGLPMVVSADPNVSATILTPQADRKEGGKVEMSCVATNLQPNHTVEWTTGGPVTSLRLDENTTLGTDMRFMFETGSSGTGITTQNLTITDLRRDDSGDYTCSIREPLLSGGTQVLASSRLQLSVLYFPKESFPICSPGPIAVASGTEVSLGCSSEIGNPPVTVRVSSKTDMSISNRWRMQDDGYMISQSLNLTLKAADDGVQFNCSISSTSFDGMLRSCTIGPISVNADEPSLHSSAIASAVAAGALVLIALFIICVCICNRIPGCGKDSPTRNETQVSNVDHYSELQKSMAEGNREHVELTARGGTAMYTKRDEETNVDSLAPLAEDTEHHVYQQSVGDTEGPDHDDETPDPACEFLEPETVTTKL